MANPYPFQGPQGPPGPIAASVATPAALGALPPVGVTFPAGALAYVQAPKGLWQLDPTSVATPDGGASVVAAASGGGNWLLRPTPLQGATVAAIASTGGTTTLSSSQALASAVETSGVLASNAVLVVPAVPGLLYVLVNGNTGAFSTTFKSAIDTGAGVAPAQGKSCLARVNAAGNLVRVTPDT